MTDLVQAAGGVGVGRAAEPVDLCPWLVSAAGGDATNGAEVDLVPIETVEHALDGSLRLRGTGALFAASAIWSPVDPPAAGWSVELEVSARPDLPAPVEAAVAVGVRVAADGDPHWLVPGVFLGENRPAESRSRYPRWVESTVDGGRPDPFTADEWWLRCDRAATPAVLASGGGLRVALATTVDSPVGQSGVGFGSVSTPDGPRREIRLSFPYREAPVVYDGSAQPLPADRPIHAWPPGEAVTLRFRVLIEPDGPGATTAILRSLHAWLGVDAPLATPLDAATTATLAADGLLRWHDRPADAALIETAGFVRGGDGRAVEPGDRLAMHVAWLSGAPAASALLAYGLRVGRDDAVASGRRVLTAIATNLAPCGTFWGQWTAERGWGKGWTPGPDAVHTRTLAEATLFLARAARNAPSPEPRWSWAVDSNVAFVRAVEREGGIPSAWNARTGEPLSWAGTASLAWVPALIEAAPLLDDPSLIDVARRVGDRYAGAIESGSLCGAPEDVDLGPTSEDGYVAIQASVALARSSSAPGARARWIELARRAADWTLAFRLPHDLRFPPGTLLAVLGFRTRGADLASPANQHLHAYGLICSEELLDLSRLTGDPHYADRARETWACFGQGIAREDGDLGGRRGMAPERYFHTRYGGPKGSIDGLSHAWCLGLLLHAAELAIRRPELAAPFGTSPEAMDA